MSGGELNYPPEVLTMVSDMQKTVVGVNQEMDALSSQVKALAGSSKSQVVGSFSSMHQQCASLMQEHNTVLDNIARKTGQGYDDMISYDRQMGSQIENA